MNLCTLTDVVNVVLLCLCSGGRLSSTLLRVYDLKRATRRSTLPDGFVRHVLHVC
jgi:hypothetical protein